MQPVLKLWLLADGKSYPALGVWPRGQQETDTSNKYVTYATFFIHFLSHTSHSQMAMGQWYDPHLHDS